MVKADACMKSRELKYEQPKKEKTVLSRTNLPLNLTHNPYGLYSL
jgi:hypothetical protein